MSHPMKQVSRVGRTICKNNICSNKVNLHNDSSSDEPPQEYLIMTKKSDKKSNSRKTL